MQEPEAEAFIDKPAFPWLWTYVSLLVVIAVAIVKPLAPNGMLEFIQRIAGIPLTLDIGEGRSVKFIEEKGFDPGCTVADLAWSDNATLILDCQRSLQAWRADGHLFAKLATPNRLMPSHLQVLGHPLRVAYHGRLGADGNGGNALTVWNVASGSVIALNIPVLSSAAFSVDPVHSQIAANDRRNHSVLVLSPETGQIDQTIILPSFAASLQWLPSGVSFLVGSFDGRLLIADSATGDVRELSKIYPDREGIIDGLAASSDGQNVLTYTTGKGTAGVEIHSTTDGHIISRMQGRSNSPVREVAWDPQDRFIACSTANALMLWNRRTGQQSTLTIDERGSHRFSISGDGQRLALIDGQGRRLRMFRIER